MRILVPHEHLAADSRTFHTKQISTFVWQSTKSELVNMTQALGIKDDAIAGG
jgi:hypothetical protein